MVVLLIPLFIALSIWQFGRMEFKNQVQKKQVQQAQTSPLSIGQIQNTPTLRFSPLKVSGHFINQYPILLDNQLYKGQAGYRVIMPFQVHNNGTQEHPWILIDRGWIPSINRNKLPDIKPVTQAITLTGIINDPPKPLRLKESMEHSMVFPKLVQYIAFNSLQQELHHKIFPFLLQLQNEEAPYAYQIIPITAGLPASKHLAYALQWLMMALAVLIYYLAINTKKSPN